LKKHERSFYNALMKKGQLTRQHILAHAFREASRVGLAGLSIGQLAQAMEMSKSGLFGHFKSKEELQIQVLEVASERFTAEVIRPGLKAPRGVPRLRALFEHWLRWAQANNEARGGCFFVAASIELDDQPGPVRDQVVSTQQHWVGVLEKTITMAISEGLIPAHIDPRQTVLELYGIMLSFHLYYRLLRDPAAETLAQKACAQLCERLTP
jgi:AcrR family transcriptional regulator